ncbi:MAG: HDOD domain-containing protein [Deltaproteobacteria bacterium]|nr:MAG: HDOD domain-containing protein [Deltaproteobacteria bacterium]TMQ18227.1 MAG: HDOD domain-containing protein [Deltaproteobacteria bacterium]
MNVKKRILFVDDEPAILAGLQNLLYKDRKRWDMVFALGGQLALDEIRKAPFDIVVSDMRMPGIDGAMLLNVVKDECPATVRIMLSGHADREAIVRALPAMHQLLSKPCDANTLRGAIERSLDGVNVERDAKIRRIVGGVDKLPTPPDIYFDLSRLMESPASSVADVAKVVIRDPGLSAKLLQLVNSAYFGTGQVTTSIQQAVALLGTDRLRYIALTASVFSSRDPDECGFSLSELQRGSMRAAWLARSFAEPALRDEAFASTLLHDVGHVVLAIANSAESRVFAQRWLSGEPPLELEEELFGVTHADVGARLLAIWGLPSTIVDVVQFHHDPGSAPEACRRLASIVHVADTAVQHMPAMTQLNMQSLERAGCAHLVPGWLAIAERAA